MTDDHQASTTRLHCRGCGRFRRTHTIAGTDPDDRYADFDVAPCPHCGTDTAVVP